MSDAAIPGEEQNGREHGVMGKNLLISSYNNKPISFHF
jgi:hypothetical protein